MDFADLVDHARVKENALGERGLARVDVRGDPDIAGPLERERALGRIRIIGSGFGLKRGGHGRDRLRSRQTEAQQPLTKCCCRSCLYVPCKHD